VKDVQGVLRHSRTATTTDVYMQEIPASVQATVNSIHRELQAKSKASGRLVEPRAAAAKRKPRVVASSADEIATKRSPGVSREKGEDARSSETVLEKGFGNLLPNATKSEKPASVTY
jgi:hypothetical protein